MLLSGEPGIGKSRLVQALKETVEHEGANTRLEFRCSPYHQNSALLSGHRTSYSGVLGFSERIP